MGVMVLCVVFFTLVNHFMLNMDDQIELKFNPFISSCQVYSHTIIWPAVLFLPNLFKMLFGIPAIKLDKDQLINNVSGVLGRPILSADCGVIYATNR
jgi:hypothetical protein